MLNKLFQLLNFFSKFFFIIIFQKLFDIKFLKILKILVAGKILFTIFSIDPTVSVVKLHSKLLQLFQKLSFE